MQTTFEKIQSFAQLQPGWGFGEGIAFAQSTLNKAIQLAKTAHTLGFHETDAFPGLNGEIMVTVYQGKEYWEFTLQPTETIIFVYERDDETVTYEEGLPFEFAVSLLTNLAFHHHHLFTMQTSTATPVPA
ncbi:MAG: hypothetical protein R3C14_33515 [Caldilineaceae bacterium]